MTDSADSNISFQTMVDACETVVPAKVWLQHRTVIAVSGGADSVALFRALTHIFARNLSANKSTSESAKLIVAHIDHAVRGEASQADRDFVENLAGEFGAKFVAVKLNLKANVGRP